MALPAPCAWLGIPDGHPFGLQTLPYGSFSSEHHPALRRVGVAVGDQVLDLSTAIERLVPGRAQDFSPGNLDRFLAAGDGAWAQVRADLVTWLSHEHFRTAIEDLLHPVSSVAMHLPFTVADYVDFYSSEQHATNVGAMFRPDDDPLQPNWRHLPVGYHGRAGTVVISGTPIRRPCGQSRPASAPGPVFGPSRRMDFEAELGFVVGVESVTGERVPASRFSEHVFGACLVNDWSARDIQGWESAPLGPFLGKILWHNDIALDSAASSAGQRQGQTAKPGHRAGRVPGRLGRLGARYRPRGQDQRAGGQPAALRHDVLEPGTDAGAPDGQRSIAAHRRPVCVRHGQRAAG
jgi:fumarylacetoacetase